MVITSPTTKLQKDPKSVRGGNPQKTTVKFEQVLLYILSEIGGEQNIGQTVLYKILYFIDFDYYEKFREHLIGAEYIKNHYGPIPVMFLDIVKKLEQDNKIETVNSKFYRHIQKKYLINPELKLDLSALTAQEIKHIDWEINRFANHTPKEISDFSHLDTPWIVAEEEQPLKYGHVFYRPPETSVGEYNEL